MAFVNLILKGNGARHARANMVHVGRDVNLDRCFSTCTKSWRTTTTLSRAPVLTQPTLYKSGLSPTTRPPPLNRRWNSSSAEGDQGIVAFRNRKNRVLQEWTPELESKLVDMRLEGSTWVEIGAALNIEPQLCHLHYKRSLDPALHQGWTPQKLEKLNNMVIAGHSWRRISKDLLMPPATIREKWLSINPEQASLLRKNRSLARKQARLQGGDNIMLKSLTVRASGLVSQRRIRWCETMDSIVVHLHQRGLTWRQIARVFGMTPIVVYLRFTGSIKLKMDEGWKPMDLDLSNVPSYLLPDRTRPPPAKDGSEPILIPNQKALVDGPTPILGLIADDFSYRIDEKMTARSWTKEEDDFILKSVQGRMSMSQIAKSLGLREGQCARRFYIDLSPRASQWTPYALEKLRFFVSQGLAWSSMEALLGFHRGECREKYLEISSTLQSSDTSGNENTSVIGNARSQNGGNSSALPSKTNSPAMTSLGLDDGDDMDDYEDDEDDEDDTEDKSNIVIDDLAESFRDGEEDIMDDDDNDDDDSDILDIDEREENEDTSDLYIGTGRRSKKNAKLSEKADPLSTVDYWDQDKVLNELRRTWTSDQETTLIRHVIRNGTTDWKSVSQALGEVHSPEECRAYWKHLDMPVYRGNAKEGKWKPYREAQFWRAWLDHGSDFEAISSKLNRNGMTGTSKVSAKEQQQLDLSSITPEDCKKIFKLRTRKLIGTYGKMEGKPKDLESLLEDEDFKRECIELALVRGKRADFKWDKEMSVKLQMLVRQRLRTRDVQVSWINWRWVARHVGGGASAQRCTLHWRSLRKAGVKNKEEWSEEDTLQLEKGIREVGSRFNNDRAINEAERDGKLSIQQSEDLVSDSIKGPNDTGLKMIQRFYLPNKTIQLLENKYFTLSDKATSVTLQEYMTIMEAVEEVGEEQWDKVVEHLNGVAAGASGGASNTTSGWTKAPCRRIWQASYRHHLLYTQWSPLEDGDLKAAVRAMGKTDWISVARFFPGKSAWQCRLRWCQITDPLNKQSTTTA